MEQIGIDVHRDESQICRLTEEGEILEQRILTRRERFAAALGRFPRTRVLIEAWRQEYKRRRAQSSLGCRPSAPEAVRVAVGLT